MSAIPNNGVEVHGFRVLITAQRRRTNIVRTLASLVLGDPSDEADHWYTVTAHDASGQVVAKRRFDRRRDAESTRKAFVKVVEASGAGSGAEMQALLDAAI